MKRTTHILLTLLAIPLLLLSSCRKKDNYSAYVQPAADRSKLNTLFAALRPAPQSFPVIAGTAQTIFGDKGTRISFYTNSFRDSMGNIITGNVTVALVEMYTPGDMIASRATTTTSDGQLLRSGGQVQVRATYNGRDILVSKYGIGFMQSAADNHPMALFYGNTLNTDSVSAWKIGAGGTGTTSTATVSLHDSTVVVVIGSTGFDTVTIMHQPANYYQFDSCVHFGWINCDAFFNSGTTLGDINVTVHGNQFDPSNTEVFIVFPSINSVSHLGRYTAATQTFDLQDGYHVPTGMAAEIAVVSNVNGQYYYFQQTGLTTGAGMTVNAVMAPSTVSDILSHLSGL